MSVMLPRLTRDMNTGGEYERASECRHRAERLRPGEGANAHRDEWLGEREHGGAGRANPDESDDEQHTGPRTDGDTPGDEVAEVGRSHTWQVRRRERQG